jgi:hypothetical protein
MVSKYLETKRGRPRRGPVEVYDHRKARMIEVEPLASASAYEDYKESKLRKSRESSKPYVRTNEVATDLFATSRRQNYSGSVESALSTAAGDSSQSPVSEETSRVSVQSQQAKTSIQDIRQSEVATSGQSEICETLGDKWKWKAEPPDALDQGESITGIMAEIPRGMLETNQVSTSPGSLAQSTWNSATVMKNSTPYSQSALDVHQSEHIAEGTSSKSPLTSSDDHNSDSDQIGSDNTSDELCDRLEDVCNEGEQIMTPILDPARQAMVDRVMTEFWVIFNQQWPLAFRQHAGDSIQESASSGDSIANQNGARPRILPRKRQRKYEEEDDERDDDGNQQPSSQLMSPAIEPANRPKLACPFRKHDPCRYNIYSHRACAQSHWGSMARVKYCTEHLFTATC